jgi:Tripartite tricarboxylate transporter TctB family
MARPRAGNCRVGAATRGQSVTQPPRVLAAEAARYAAGEIGRESMIRVKSPQDFWAGILFVLFGCVAIWIGRNYAFGTLTRMGPGYLPAVLSWALVAIGGVLTVRALALDGPAIEPSRVMPQLFILAAIVVFALTIERLGLALAVALVALTAAFASRDMRWLEALALALGLAALCVLLFVHLLGQPFTVWAF